MLDRIRQLLWRRRKLTIIFTSLLVGMFFVLQLFLNFQIMDLTIAAGPARGESYQLARAIAEQLVVCNARVRLKVLETKGSEQNLELLQAGKVQLASIPITSSLSNSVKLVSYLFNDLFQLVVTEKSGVNQIADLKGKRIAIPPLEDKADDFFWILVKHYRVARQDLSVTSMTGAAADDAFLNNRVDAVFRSRPAGNKFIQKLVRDGNASIIPIDQAAALKIQYPEFGAAILPKGVYQGNVATPAQDLPTISVQRILVANSRVSTEAIQELTKTIYENRQVLMNKMPLANEISPPDTSGGSLLPLHLGAANYYNRSEPDFFTKNSDLLGLAVTISLAALSWLWQFKEQFARTQKNRSDLYNTELIQLMDDINNCHDLESLDKMRQLMYQKFAIAIEAFDCDRITFESLQSIRFTWDATMLAIKDRESYLLRHLNSAN
ncbi:TAXI family TRAP transporter solute-binding subunit [Chamaesiphon sp. VAR_69_metabat_338]|uniref:TAXI family TRAP transporter solute-binding subunit n=1 Tax=Chamaesiphon sp. VAR_69_metabat_338 TaxID=2964704 RepID=UPI00286E631A|nr:TAXI family TRAP transporter solute-binding subunit [Chamaesiphon sp. VAR_69_metabat_338]